MYTEYLCLSTYRLYRLLPVLDSYVTAASLTVDSCWACKPISKETKFAATWGSILDHHTQQLHLHRTRIETISFSRGM